MKRSIARIGLVFVTLLGLAVGRNAFAGLSVQGFEDAVGATDEVKHPSTKTFKLKGGGQIDLATLTLEFSGKAAPLGNYTATGTINPATFQIQGTITVGKVNCLELDAAKNDSINWIAAFQPGPLGDFQALFTFTGGTGKFVDATGTASGPVVLDPDFMFTINLEGKITY